MENKQKTDLELANQKLMELKANIAASDRKECPRSVAIVVKYLNGEGTDLDTAMELIEFFRKRIEDRRKVLNESQS